MAQTRRRTGTRISAAVSCAAISVLLGLLGPVPAAQGANEREPDLVPLGPVRLWDSRPEAPRGSSGQPAGALQPGTPVQLPLAATPGLRASARAVVLNIAVTAAAASGYLRVWPCGSPEPAASSLNASPGEDTANQVTVAIDTTRSVCIVSTMQTHVVVDANAAVPRSSGLRVSSPWRALDTRTRATTVPAGGVLRVPVGGRRGLPGGAGLALVNLTATSAASNGYLTAYPCSAEPPTSSVLNYRAEESRANAAWVRLDTTGAFCLRSAAQTHVIVDVSGHAALRSSGTVPIVPDRVVDTRRALGIPGWVAPQVTFSFAIPAMSDRERYREVLLLNVTATQPRSAGHLTLWPCGERVPNASSLNFAAGATRANAVAMAAGQQGRICLRASTATHVVVDVNGYVVPVGRSVSYAPAAAPALRDGMTPTERAMVAAVNRARSQARACGAYGHFPAVPALRPRAQLARAAQLHADEMALSDVVTHTGADGSRVGDRVTRVGYAWSSVGENIAAGHADPDAAVSMLLRSPGHCRNLMTDRYTDLGVGYAFNPGSTYRHYWTQNFGSRR